MIYYKNKSSDSFYDSVTYNPRERQTGSGWVFPGCGIGRDSSRDSRNVNGMRDLSATGGSGIRQNLGTDVRLGKKTFFWMATTKVRSAGFSRKRKRDCGIRTPPSCPWPPGGRGTPLYKPYRFVLPQRVGFLSRFRLKTGRLRPFWSGMGYGFRHLRRPRGSQSGRLKGATKVNRPDWLSLSLRGWVFEGTTRTTGSYERIYRLNSKWVRKKAKICELEIGFSEIGSGFWELGDIPPPRISRSPPPPAPFFGPWPDCRKQRRKNLTNNSSEQCMTARVACDWLVLPLQYYQPRGQ